MLTFCVITFKDGLANVCVSFYHEKTTFCQTVYVSNLLKLNISIVSQVVITC